MPAQNGRLTRSLTVGLTQPEREAIEHHASVFGVSMNWMVRRMIQDWLESQEEESDE